MTEPTEEDRQMSFMLDAALRSGSGVVAGEWVRCGCGLSVVTWEEVPDVRKAKGSEA